MPPASQQKCEQCHRKPKFIDPVTGQAHPYCGRTCAATAKANSKGSHAPSQRQGTDSNASARQSAKLLRTVGEELSKAKQSIGDGIDNDLINRFKKKNLWQFSDVKGGGDVTMSREFGNESISVAFSLNKTEPFDDFADAASDDEGEGEGEDEDEGDGSNDGSGGGSSDEDDKDQDLVLACTISISKPGKGVMLIHCDAVDGEFEILNFSSTQDTKLAVVKSAEHEYTRESMYVSPEFYELGEQFQEQFVEYLALRGIDSDLARFVQEYSKYKEKLEQVNWLERVQDFL